MKYEVYRSFIEISFGRIVHAQSDLEIVPFILKFSILSYINIISFCYVSFLCSKKVLSRVNKTSNER